jgi:hypothetical protein
MADTKLAPKPVSEIVEVNAPAIDITKTPRKSLIAAGVKKVCRDCGEGVHSRKDEHGKTEVYCPNGKSRCSFVKEFTDVIDKINGVKIDDPD